MSAGNASELREFIARLAPSVARYRALRLLERRDYPCGELQERLMQDGFDHDVARSVVEDLGASNIVSDDRFARSFATSKIAAGWGLMRIERELTRRGVEVSQLANWPNDYVNPEEELKRALEVASKKVVREPNAQAKMTRFLVGRGFAYDIARRAATKSVRHRKNA